jgi:cell division septal protein FtsQ
VRSGERNVNENQTVDWTTWKATRRRREKRLLIAGAVLLLVSWVVFLWWCVGAEA